MRFLMIGIGIVVLTGCSNNFNSSVKKNAKVSELSDEDACTLGREIAEEVTGTFAEDFCYIVAQGFGIAADVTGGDYTAACETAYDECAADSEFANVDWDEAECNPEALAECDSTVGDLEECLNDSLSLLRGLASKKCRPQTIAEFEEASAEFENGIPSCDALDESCPGAF